MQTKDKKTRKTGKVHSICIKKMNFKRIWHLTTFLYKRLFKIKYYITKRRLQFG
jgi:hypothetical protein